MPRKRAPGLWGNRKVWLGIAALIVLPWTNQLWSPSALSYFDSKSDGGIISCSPFVPVDGPPEEPGGIDLQAGPMVLDARASRPPLKNLSYAELETFWQLRARLTQFVGDEGAEAFEADLKWIQSVQFEDGSWGDLETTRWAMLALIGAGEWGRGRTQGKSLESARVWLWEQADFTTGLFHGSSPQVDSQLQVLATLALAESYAVDRHPIGKRRVAKAIEYLADHEAEAGGWQVHSSERSHGDVALTAQVLETADCGNVDFDRSLITGTLTWLDSITNPETGAVDCTASSTAATDAQVAAMTAAALNGRIALGQLEVEQYPSLQITARQLGTLLQSRPELTDQALRASSFAMFHMGGEFRQDWGLELAALLQKPQPANRSLAQVAIRSLTSQPYFRARSLEEILAFKEEARRLEEERAANALLDVIGRSYSGPTLPACICLHWSSVKRGVMCLGQFQS